MMDAEALEHYSQKVKKLATGILETTHLLEVLGRYGDVHVIGSYPLDVMYGPDIDLVVQTKDPRRASVQALEEIIDKELFRKVEYGDFVKFPMENRPQGYILVLKVRVEQVDWEIEVWFLEDVSKQIQEHNVLKSGLNEQNRIEILKAKHLRAISGIDKHAQSSYAIYEEVLGKLEDC